MSLSDEYSTLDQFVRQLMEKYGELEENHLKEHGLLHLSAADIRAMHRIGQSRRERMSNLAGHLKLTVGTLTTTIDRLVQKGYVHRQRPEDDRRVVEISLSEKGATAYEQIEHARTALAERVFSVLDDEERKSLKDILTKLLKE